MKQGPARLLVAGWCVAVAGAVSLRVWNAVFGPLLYGYDAWGHLSYVFFLDMFHSIPYADQGWSYFHPPLHYLFGWALMQFGDPDVLVVGLSLLGGAASLGIAALAVAPIRQTLPDRPGLALLGFAGLAYLPVHVYVSPMPGNEMTATFFAAAAFVAHLRNECRDAPRLWGDVLTGALAGLAMLSKFTDIVPCIAIFALTVLRWLRSGELRRDAKPVAVRLFAIAVPLLLIAGPYYARNLSAFGTPFMTSAAVHDVARVQAEQLPGDREFLDYLRFPLAVGEDSLANSPHMLRAIWPNTYLNVWFDTFRESQLPFPRDLIPHPFIHQLTLLFGILGMIPTLVALLGAASSLRRALAERHSCVDLAMLVLASGTLAAFVAFSVAVPTWAALKASYLLNLSLPFAFFLARGTLVLARRDRWLGRIPEIAVAVAALATSYVFATGTPPGLMQRDSDSIQMHSVRAHFGDFDATRRAFLADAPKRSYVEARAAAELLDGRPGAARRFYRIAGERPLEDPSQRPYWLNRLAVANVLDGYAERARLLLDEALRFPNAEGMPELLVNRAALRAEEGKLGAAESDLRAAILQAPQLPPAWTNLAVVLERLGRSEEAADARARAAKAESKPPRGFPYGVGNGFLHESGAGQRFMLILEPDSGAKAALSLSLYRPSRARNWPKRPVGDEPRNSDQG